MGREYKESAFGAATAYIVRAAARAHMAQPRGATPRLRSGTEAGRTPCPKGGAQEELPDAGGQGQRPRVPGCDGREELPPIQGRGRGAAERSYPTPPHQGPGAAARRSNPMPEARGGGREDQHHVQGAMAA